MRRNDESAIAGREQELHIRVIRTLITFAEEIFESDPTEKYADPSFTSVTLMPNFGSSIPSENLYPGGELPTTSSGLFRSLWQSAVSSVPHLITTCTEIIESSQWNTQLYYIDVKDSEAESVVELLMSRKAPQFCTRLSTTVSVVANIFVAFRLRTKAAAGREKTRRLRVFRCGYSGEETHRWQTNSFDSA